MTRHPASVIFSFRFLIELLTTFPFIVSTFIPNGQFVYDKPTDPLNTKLIHLVSTLIVLIYNGTCAFQYTEATFGNKDYTILDSLYVVMVTLSTVGYGALAVLPTLIGDVCDTVQKRKEGAGHVSEASTPFILIVGSFRFDQVVEILDGFLNKESTKFHLNVVFLDINRPTEQLKMMERNSIWGHRVQFLQGSVLDEKTLLRVNARHAAAIFTLSDQNASNPSTEDERNTVRLWSLYCHTVSHDVPIYTYNLSPSTAIYQKVAKEIICVREFKQYLLAMNCRCRGASTLLTNLLHQRQPLNNYDEGWQAQFGIKHILYLFEEAQVVLFAVKTFMQSREEYEILLNPSNSYLIKETDECVYIAEGPREIRELEHLPRPKTCYRLDQKLSKRPFKTNFDQNKEQFKIATLPSKRHAILTGSRELIKRIGSGQDNHTTFLPLCYLLERPVQLEDITIDSARHMTNHILVCLHREVINMFKFIYKLRSPNIKSDELQDIVLLCPNKPSKKAFELINIFPRGNCRQPEDLLRAGAKTAKQVVVMSEKECLDQYERNSDSPAV
ncbi:hypothetical protein RO3G_03654 [Rhizopus delemar RA 99-880]|uniref:Calcium-activated potassium channel BK alpha subunit domain-containing protein n=1 Tax=Rhizopus delemar (strain RA 99-880 / ATCC MYA-4621 / FGSC 9543 / NRRL 43880) TaxID=246409 RepID=I1BRW9_RHIO9|nr:hypothetical protein RO3G_03654 [Rhizopus delemar RA 99-880]|eukprot:EIE78949.1 hypothetical protein RO3G_03654 [Rhizopus delemar RA 99-880]